MARPRRGRARQRQHLRRLRGDGANARDVQEEGAALMHEAVGAPAWVMLAYLVAGICFILALRGLSNPESARRGNRAGMAGMLLAVGTTLIHYQPLAPGGIVGGVDTVVLVQMLTAIGIGGAIGIFTARRIAMTAMPQLVA